MDGENNYRQYTSSMTMRRAEPRPWQNSTTTITTTRNANGETNWGGGNSFMKSWTQGNEIAKS